MSVYNFHIFYFFFVILAADELMRLKKYLYSISKFMKWVGPVIGFTLAIIFPGNLTE